MKITIDGRTVEKVGGKWLRHGDGHVFKDHQEIVDMIEERIKKLSTALKTLKEMK